MQHRDRVPPNYEDARFVVRFKRQYTCRREYDEEHKVRPCGKEGPQDVTRMLRVLGLLRVLGYQHMPCEGRCGPKHARTRTQRAPLRSRTQLTEAASGIVAPAPMQRATSNRKLAKRIDHEKVVQEKHAAKEQEEARHFQCPENPEWPEYTEYPGER